MTPGSNRSALAAWRFTPLLLPAALAGCGAGTAGIFAASSSSSSSGNGSPSVSQLRVESNKVPSAEIRFTATDAEGDPVTIEFCYEVVDPMDPTGLTLVRERMAEIGSNPSSFPADADGESHSVPWNFPGETYLPDDGRYEEPVRVIAILSGGQELVVGEEGDFGMGNDPPVVTQPGMELAGAEVEGIVPVRFTVEDTSDDVVDIRVEYNADGTWRPARPGGIPARDPTPDPAIAGVQALRAGTDLVFFWDTDHDLEDGESDVLVRFTPDDGASNGLGLPEETPQFRVDNNAEPLAVLASGQVTASPDRRRGIPLPFDLFDDEGDLTQVVVQWRQLEGSFPDLPGDPERIRAILADPVQRREYQIATEYPTPAGGTVVPRGGAVSNTVRLPELGTTASRLLADGIVGRELEILRRTKRPAAAGSSSLQAPVAVLPYENPGSEDPDEGDPLTLVLDAQGGGRLAWVDLAKDEVRQQIPTAGTPSALAFEPGARSVVVASDVGGTWQLERVDLATLQVTLLVTVPSGLEHGTVRGLTCLGRDEALLTVASSLVHARYPDNANASAVALREALDTPWGVLVDPWDANRVYLAERDATTATGIGRVSTFALDGRLLVTAVEAFERPTSLAFDRGTARLLALTDDGQTLRGIDLGVAGAEAFELASFGTRAAGLATGPDGLRIAALTSANDLVVGGGVQQRRTIETYDPGLQTVTVDEPFEPPLETLTPWRVTPSVERVVASASGTHRSFVWDSGDLEGGGKALFRLTPFDSEAGTATESAVSKEVLSPFELAEDALHVGGDGTTDGATSGLAADLDGDGDLDLVSANAAGHTLTIFYQDAGAFEELPSVVLPIDDFGSCVDFRYAYCFPLAVAAGDLDGNGYLDLVTANNTRNDLCVFYQADGGGFDTPAVILGGPFVTRRPGAVALADLDGDGHLDVVSANGGATGTPLVNPSLFRGQAEGAEAPSDSVTGQDAAGARAGAQDGLTIFLQKGGGGFDPARAPIRLGSSSTTAGPRSVAAGDLDGDGLLDLVSANAQGNDLTAFLQPAGGFVDEPQPSLRFGDATTTNRPRSVAAADLDQDGDLDLVSANLGLLVGVGMAPADIGNDLLVFFQPAGGFASPGGLPIAPSLRLGDRALTQDPSFVLPVDLDGDGDLDLAATVQALDAATTDSNLALCFQTSPGVFTPPRPVGDATTTGSPAALAAADLDGDGRLDLVSFNSSENLPVSGNDLTLFYQVEPGRPDPDPRAFGDLSRLGELLAGDLDGDGDLDLLATDTGFAYDVLLYSQGSPGGFDDGAPVVPGVPVSSLAIGDLNGDGNLDMAVGRFREFALETYFQSESGEFVPSGTLLGPTFLSTDLVPVDLDGDGDNDLLSTNAFGIPGQLQPNLSLFLQTSPGTFAPQPLVLADDSWQQLSQAHSYGPNSVVAADLDGDGDLDLATENSTSSFALMILNDNPGGDLTLFLQDGSTPGLLAFEPPRQIASSGTRRPGEIEAADLDGDGDLDLFTANFFGDDLTIYYQDARGHFAEAVVLGNASLTNSPVAIEAADLDQDGVLELISANFGSSTAPGQAGPVGNVTVFEQNGVGRFDPLPVTLAAPTIDGAARLIVVDLDGDGELDVTVGDGLTQQITVFYGGRD